MRLHIPCTALGLATLAVAPAAHAQTVITPQIMERPAETISTVTTVRTVRPIAHHRVITIRRTTTTRRVVPAARTVVGATTYSGPLYDVVTPAPAPAPVVTAPYYRQPLYNTVVETPSPVVPAPAVTSAPLVDEVAAPAPAAVGSAVPFYRYVYQPDRILVIDPNTGIAVQAIPR